MNIEQYMKRVLEAAQAAGITTAEVFASSSSSFDVRAVNSTIDSYEVSTSIGLSLRGSVNGKTGSSSTQAMDDDAIQQLVEGVIESASLNECEEQDEIYAGDASYPTLEEPFPDLDSISAQAKVDACMAIDQAAYAADSRIKQTEGSCVSVSSGTRYLLNSYGLDLKASNNVLFAYCCPVAKDGDATSTGMDMVVGHAFADLDPTALGTKAAAEAVSMLHAEPVPSGKYRVIFQHEAMSSLLGVFSGMFSAENAQQKLSLLAGKEGALIASPIITIMDDPLLPGGPASRIFDGEGCATKTKAIVDHGILTTLLHNRKTAKKQGVETTGNAARSGYSGMIHVGPTNLFIKPGEKTLDDLMADAGNGLLITDVSGLHAGANAVSGDFSLLSKGFILENGKKTRPVERITVAGNFYRLLESIQAVGNDLRFNGSSIASPSIDAGELTISGT